MSIIERTSTDTTISSKIYEDGSPLNNTESNQSTNIPFEDILSEHNIFDTYGKEEGNNMDWQEKYIDELNKNIRDISVANKEFRSELKAVQNNMEESFDRRLSQFMLELRDRDNQRHAEILAMQNRSDESIQQLKIEISGAKTEMRATQKWIIGLVIAASLSFLAIAGSLSIGMVNVLNIVDGLAKTAIKQ